MTKQVVVIGLGQFGMGLIRALSRAPVEVIAIDSDEDRMQLASTWVTRALCFDATQEAALSELQPRQRDVFVVATGDQSKEVGIICTALLKQLGAKRIIARANDELHARILRLVGADDVVNPEWDFGERFAPRILSSHILGEMLLGSDLVVSEFEAPKSMHNRTIRELNLQRGHGITLIAVRSARQGGVRQVAPDDRIEPGDILVSASKQGSLEHLLSEA